MKLMVWSGGGNQNLPVPNKSEVCNLTSIGDLVKTTGIKEDLTDVNNLPNQWMVQYMPSSTTAVQKGLKDSALKFESNLDTHHKQDQLQSPPSKYIMDNVVDKKQNKTMGKLPNVLNGLFRGCLDLIYLKPTELAGSSFRWIKQSQPHVKCEQSSVLTSVLLFVILTSMLVISPVKSACNPTTSCYPEPADLLNLTFAQRSLSVSSTCGMNGATTMYRKGTQSNVAADTTNYFCNASIPHPKENMVDSTKVTVGTLILTSANLTTYWQSENTAVNNAVQKEVEIIGNFTDPFLIRFITVTFTSPHVMQADKLTDMRPLAMVFERNVNGAWQPYRYYARDCKTSFPNVLIKSTDGTGPNYNATTPVCQQRYYSGHEATFTNWGYGRQIVSFNPSYDYQSEYDKSLAVQQYYTSSAVRVRMTKPSSTVDLTSYYAVADMEVMGQCSCFGHAASCTGTNKAECVCSHNTLGKNCEQCQPMYNNRPWNVGGNECQDCACNGHSTTCHYDVAKGYGVCDNCTDKTLGDKCEWCNTFYYVNPVYTNATNATLDTGTCSGFNGTQQESYNCSNYCIPCNCSVDGSIDAKPSCNNGTGDCQCRTNVQGRICDECKDGFWNLTQTNGEGCMACSCHAAGTNNGSLCDKVTGKCLCKANVEGLFCDNCTAGTYNMSSSNPLGCTGCNCDSGGAITSVCDNSTGACTCRPNINSMNCNLPKEGFYIPKLDYLAFEAELAQNAATYPLVEESGYGQTNTTVTGRGFVQLQQPQTLVFTVVVPKTFQYDVDVRYRTTATWSNMGIAFAAVNGSTHPNKTFTCAGQSKDLAVNEVASGTVPPATSAGGVLLSSKVCLRGKTQYTMTVTVPVSSPAGATLLLDSIVLIPDYKALTAYSTGSAATKTKMEQCYNSSISVNLATRMNLTCQPEEYSLMAELMGEASVCFCNPTGSVVTTSCDPYSGQCQCKPNVMYPDCSQCTVGHYNFLSGTGCTACNCHLTGSEPKTCNETGVCSCKPNVIGQKCDSCLPEYYGLSTGQGCTKCSCNLAYSYNNSCLDSGQCLCKPGVGGQNCDQCINGTFNLTSQGCTTCSCDPLGSYSGTCDKGSGTCMCLQQVEGSNCDACKAGHYGLGKWSEQGCLKCLCSGHSSNCTSATGWNLTRYDNTWSLLDAAEAVKPQWTGVRANGTTVPVNDPVVIDSVGSQYVMRLFNTETTVSDMLYFVATAPYLGNKQGAYSHTLKFTLGYFIPQPQPQNFTVEYLNSVDGDVILKGTHASFKLVANLTHIPTDSRNAYSFKLRESEWRVDTLTGAVPTFTQFMTILNNLGAIWVRAKFTNLTNSYSNLYSASLDYSTNVDATTSTSVNNMEQCVCPTGFEGQFCEKCSAGYTRNPPNSGSNSKCVPCSCNQHGSGCDPETGVCVCMHNTTGDHCETCKTGFYGNPLSGTPNDCQACQCPGNVIQSEANVFATTCALKTGGGSKCDNCTVGHGGDQCEFCLPNYYGTPQVASNNGGKCSSCVCNTRADTCNSTTGMCVNCRNNTAGKECETCAPGYFGDAMKFSCKPCNCTNIGATGGCNPVTGQCVCHPNVLGFKCEGPCAQNTYNYTSGQGCSACNCHTPGAVSPSCNQTTGQCLCNTLVKGRQCDRCEDTYWNILTTGCQSCGCTNAGTINQTSNGLTFGTCELNTGQCNCALPGIIGRTCDFCAKGTLGVNYTYITEIYIGQYPQCSLCGECFDNWAKKIDAIGVTIENLYAGVLTVWANYNNLTASSVQPVLDSISGNLTGVTSSIQLAQDMVDKLNYIDNGFTQVLNDVNNLTLEVDKVTADYNSVQQTLIGVKSFNALIIVNQTHQLNIPQFTAQINAISNQQDLLFSQGNASWIKIQELSTLIAQSTGNVSTLLSRVTTAMQTSASGKIKRQTADVLLSGSVAQGFTSNIQKLANLQGIVNGFPVIIHSINASIARSNEMNNMLAADLQLNISAIKAAEMNQNLTAVQTLKLNATQADNITREAVTLTKMYMDVAAEAKQNATYAIEIIAHLYNEIPALNQQKAQAEKLIVDINNTKVEPLQSVNTVAQAILSTAVPQQQVTDTINKANAANTVAQQAQQITTAAEQSSQLALTQVRQITANLNESNRVVKATQNQTNNINRDVDHVQNALSIVNAKVQEANALGINTSAAVTSLEKDVASVQVCFSDKQNRTKAARDKITVATGIIQEATKVQTSNTNQLATATLQVGQVKAATQASYQSVQAVKADMDKLQADLAAVQAITNLQNLYNEASSHRVQMEVIEQEITTLDTEVNVLITELETLANAPQVSCIHNRK